MVIEWREREHEEIDATVGRDAKAKKYLNRCGLYKFWALKGMRDQVRLLHFLVNYSNPETESFNLDGQPLRIEVDNIYFITRLSFRGEVVNLKARGARGGMTMEEYISTHCVVGTDKVGIQLPIRAIENLSLNIFVLLLTWILGSASLH